MTLPEERLAKRNAELLEENQSLRERLAEAEEALNAIRSGEIDALVVTGANGEQRIYSLESAEHLYRILVETMNEGTATLSEDGTILYGNSRLADMLKTPLQKVIGRLFREFVSPAELDRFVQLFRQGLQGNSRAETELVDSTGTAFPVYFSSRSLVNAKVRGSCVVVADLTELKHTREQLEKSKRLADIGMLAASMAHELRNPLAGIRLAAYNIGRKVNQENIRKHLETIDKKVLESDQIINNLLFYSMLKTPHFEAIPIYNFLDEFLENKLEQYHKFSITFELHYEALRNVFVNGDPVQLREMVANILNNAVDAVVARKDLAPQAGRVTITGTVDSFLELRFTDNGVGIDEQNLSRIFEPFFSTKSKGTGLGLFVCHQIVDLHNGTINIESRKGAGTEVRVRLPLQQADTGGEAATG